MAKSVASKAPLSLYWRGTFESVEVDALHAGCFNHPLSDTDWWKQVNAFSIGWVCVRSGSQLIGFVNVAWDGGVHAFVLDTAVSKGYRRQGVARSMIDRAIVETRKAGCEWLHVDFGPHLRPFYLEACGFQATNAGLIRLQ